MYMNKIIMYTCLPLLVLIAIIFNIALIDQSKFSYKCTQTWRAKIQGITSYLFQWCQRVVSVPLRQSHSYLLSVLQTVPPSIPAQ